MALITQTRWENRRWNAAGIERLDGVPTAVLDCWGVRLRKRWLSAALNGGRSVADGYEFDLSTKARLQWLHRPLDRLGFDWLEGGILKEQIVLDSFAGVPDPAVFDVLVELPVGVSLHYQPALTQEQINRGDVRPPPVVGSYAVFDPFGAKLGHIFRPFAETATGQRRWLDLMLSPHALGVVLRIVLDRTILAALPPAAWPVVIDPTFGHTSIGASNTGYGYNYIQSSGPHSPASNGDVTSISLYLNEQNGGAYSITMGLWAANGSNPGTLLKDSAGGTFDGGPQWYTQNLDSAQAVVSGTNYWIGSNHNSPDSGVAARQYYDDNASFHRMYQAQTYSAGSLISFSSPGDAGTQKCSFYATYTEATSGNKDTWLPRGMARGMRRHMTGGA